MKWRLVAVAFSSGCSSQHSDDACPQRDPWYEHGPSEWYFSDFFGSSFGLGRFFFFFFFFFVTRLGGPSVTNAVAVLVGFTVGLEPTAAFTRSASWFSTSSNMSLDWSRLITSRDIMMVRVAWNWRGSMRSMHTISSSWSGRIMGGSQFSSRCLISRSRPYKPAIFSPLLSCIEISWLNRVNKVIVVCLCCICFTWDSSFIPDPCGKPAMTVTASAEENVATIVYVCTRYERRRCAYELCAPIVLTRPKFAP